MEFFYFEFPVAASVRFSSTGLKYVVRGTPRKLARSLGRPHGISTATGLSPDASQSSRDEPFPAASQTGELEIAGTAGRRSN